MPSLSLRLIPVVTLVSTGCIDDAAETHEIHGLEGKADSIDIVHQSGIDDVTVLRARTTMQLIHPSILGKCDRAQELPNGRVELDCTDAIDAQIAASDSLEDGVLAHRFVIVAHDQDGAVMPPSSGIPCQITEIETAARTQALAAMEHVGFYFSGSSRGMRLLDGSALVSFGEALGLDGEPRTLHRFYAALPCWAGTASSSQHATYEFKPFVDFLGEDGLLYRNWDPVPANYVLTGGSGVTSFDRTHEVLP